jgi:CHASE3 domain sensor protein
MKTLNLFGTPSIRRRISSAFLIVTIFVIVMAAASFFQLRQVRPFSDLIIQNSSDLVNIQRLSSATSALDTDLERYLVIRGVEYRESVQMDLQEMADVLAFLQKNPNADTQAILSKLEETTTSLQKEVQPLLDLQDPSSSSGDINRSIVTVYSNLDQLKLLQEELSAKTLASLQSTAQTPLS